MQLAQLLPGDLAPWFKVRSPSNESFVFDTVAGRYVLLCFFGSMATDFAQRAWRAVFAERALFDDDKLCLFGVSNDPDDEAQDRVRQAIPGIRLFWDFDKAVSIAYGARSAGSDDGGGTFAPRWILLDSAMRVVANVAFEADGSEIDGLMARLRALPPPCTVGGRTIQAPILVLPNVFEPAFCAHLIELYQRNGGVESGFMRERDGKTVGLHDHSHKRRADYTITDEDLMRLTRQRVVRRVVPQIHRAYQFQATRMERYIVACYAANDGGHFRPHRDNTTRATVHRRFAVSINLNDDFDGGEVSFPEYGPQGFKPPAGGAVVFSCSLLHAVSRVTRGDRYVFLPFLYDDAAAEIRQRNLEFLMQDKTLTG